MGVHLLIVASVSSVMICQSLVEQAGKRDVVSDESVLIFLVCTLYSMYRSNSYLCFIITQNQGMVKNSEQSSNAAEMLASNETSN